MSITRPTNSQNVQVLGMPEGPSAPDTKPTELAKLFNEIWGALAHFHEDGTQEPPPYLGIGGVWARPYDNGRQTLQRVAGSGQNPLADVELWWNNNAGVAFPIGFARDLPLELTDLDNLLTVGLYWYATPIMNAPSGIPHGNIWVQKNVRGGQDYYYQIVYGDNASLAVRRGTYNNELQLVWQDWGRISFAGQGGGGAVPLGGAIYFMGQTMPPQHMQADGSILYITDHPDAFAAYGTEYGGDGITTFGIPDMRSQPPLIKGGMWIVAIGDDTGYNTRFYTGRGGWVGMPDLYVGQPFPV